MSTDINLTDKLVGVWRGELDDAVLITMSANAER
jgi:hypothetical protein